VAEGSTFVTREAARRYEMAHVWRSIFYSSARHRLGISSRHEVEEIADGYAVFGGMSCVVNGAGGIGLGQQVTRQDFSRLERFFFNKNAPVKLHLSPLAHTNLRDLTAQHGYTLGGFFSVLVCDLSPDWQPAPLPDGITITQASPEQADLWVNTSAKGFEESEQPSTEAVKILAPNFYADEATCFLAWAEGEPAGAGGMYQFGGVIELGGASTRPAFRRRGIQRALIEARMQYARAMDCDTAIILTEPASDSQRNAERLGFRLAYTQVTLIKSA
jgi:GNAT superfamily N-acetyltransferase